LAGIYLGTITRWNDPAISTANPQVQLPASKIVVLHSVAGRGSTYIWSDYLSKVSAEWRTKVGRGMAVEWPVGKEAEGNSNLARMVKQVSNSIGYVELVYAVQNQLPSGLVQNAAGNFIAADSSSITAAGAAAVRLTPSDWRTSITNPPGDRSYPITSFTWILFSENVGSASKQEAIKQFLRWALEDGQSNVEPAGFAPLPKTIVETELRSLEGMP
jgi:phosphate transport system substrate-binding protein